MSAAPLPGPTIIRTAKPRKPRRLTLRQAIDCETAPRGSSTRCRCGGQKRGLRRCDPIKPTRWDFAALPATDPHYIPPQRRRVSPRTAMHMLKKARERIALLTPAVAAAAGKVIREAMAKVARVVEAERIFSEVRRRRSRILAGLLPFPLEFLTRIGSWLERRAKAPPGNGADAGALALAQAECLRLRLEIQTGRA